MNEGKPSYTYNWFGLDRYTVESPTAIESEKATIKLTFDYDGGGIGKGGTAKLFVDGRMVAEGRIEKTEPAVFSADETADVGVDDATQVAEELFENREESEFTGFVDSVRISISDEE
jgi:arylsulfatase